MVAAVKSHKEITKKHDLNTNFLVMKSKEKLQEKLETHIKSKKSTSKSKTKQTLDTTDKASLIASCINAAMSIIPPAFCYIKGGNAGVVPSFCSCGYEMYGALCYADCGSGNSLVLGICMSECPSGYTDLGLVCEKSGIYWTVKKTWMPKSYTFFDSRASCKRGYYKSGALCYKDCGYKGMVNCGIGACAGSTASCAGSIISMVVSVVIGFVQLAALFVAPESSPADTAMAAEAKTALSTIVNAGKAVIANITRMLEVFTTRRLFLESVAKLVASTVGTLVAQEICMEVADGMLLAAAGKSAASLNADQYDFTGVLAADSSCSQDLSSSSAKYTCSQSILNVISLVDPTGIFTIAAALMEPICSL